MNLFERQESFFNINPVWCRENNFFMGDTRCLAGGRRKSGMKKGLEMEGWLKNYWECGTWGGTHLVGDSEAEALGSSKTRVRLQLHHRPLWAGQACATSTEEGVCVKGLGDMAVRGDCEKKNIVEQWKQLRGCTLKDNIVWKLAGHRRLPSISLRGNWAVFNTTF